MTDTPQDAVLIRGPEHLHPDGRVLFALLQPQTREIVAFGGIGHGQFQAPGGVLQFQFPYRIETTSYGEAFEREEMVRKAACDAKVQEIQREIAERQRRILPAHPSIDMMRRQWHGHGGDNGNGQ